MTAETPVKPPTKLERLQALSDRYAFGLFSGAIISNGLKIRMRPGYSYQTYNESGVHIVDCVHGGPDILSPGQSYGMSITVEPTDSDEQILREMTHMELTYLDQFRHLKRKYGKPGEGNTRMVWSNGRWRVRFVDENFVLSRIVLCVCEYKTDMFGLLVP